MAQFSRLSIPDLLRDTLPLYTNARDDAEIAAGLADPYDYTADDFAAGLALRQAVIDGAEGADAETVDSREATADAQKAAQALRDQYAKHRDAARRYHERGSEGYSALRLAGRAPGDRAGLIDAARRFYNTVAARPDLAEPVRGLTPAVVAAAQALVAAADDTSSEQDDEAGEARTAARTYQAAVEALRTHAAELAAVAEEAFEDRPDLLRKLGL